MLHEHVHCRVNITVSLIWFPFFLFLASTSNHPKYYWTLEEYSEKALGIYGPPEQCRTFPIHANGQHFWTHPRIKPTQKKRKYTKRTRIWGCRDGIPIYRRPLSNLIIGWICSRINNCVLAIRAFYNV